MYLALYRKYRPQTFSDVISQEHITTTLSNQLKTGQIAHAYLFTGSRGTGKTTCAKIFAKAINCENSKNGDPCLECDACKQIEEGISDIMEIDAASNNSVDDVRALRDEVMYTPINCKYRVYIIDEVHMLSTSAFNALLKTIEEPPAHVVFILATTESHKVPATILSRCQRFEFRRIDVSESTKRLLEIAKKENITLSEGAASLISRLSDGGMRDALSLLDQCLSVSQSVDEAVVRDCSGIAGTEHLFEMARFARTENAAGAIMLLNDLHNASKDLAKVVEEMIGFYRNLMVLKVSVENKKTMRAMPEEIDKFLEEARHYSLEEILRDLDILSECFEKIVRTKQTKSMAETGIIKLCTPKLDINEKALLNRISDLEKKLGVIKFSPITVQEIPQNSNDSETENTVVISDEQEMPPLYFSVEEENYTENNYLQSANIDEQTESNNNNYHYQSDLEKDISSKQEVLNWAQIIDETPPYIAGLLDGTSAKISKDSLLIDCSEGIKSLISTPKYLEEIKQAVKNALGINYKISFSEAETVKEEKVNKLQLFLDSCHQNGVVVKE